MTAANKQIYAEYLRKFAHPDPTIWRTALNEFFAADAELNVVHPFNRIDGSSDYHGRFLVPLARSFLSLFRRDYILTAGEFEGGEWVSSTGYYVGNFADDWLGIEATNRLAWLRVGEFHRMDNGKAVESYVFLDIPELMIACGQWPEIPSPATTPGYTGLLPGPATEDGLQFADNDASESAKSLTIVEEMLRKLATPDEAWRPFWHKNMMWYGPAAFGSFVGVDKFRSFQVPFEGCFSHWVGGAVAGSETRHFNRHGDGNYVCSGGWPSLNARQVKPFLGQPATDSTLYMRVCDWWRREGELLVENWVFVDIPHVLQQMGFDLFAELECGAK